ncbi:MAG: sps1B [Myxococcales bacterium]|nr:sps1B [Myxococcales bacterium]
MSDESDERIGSVVDERYKIVDTMASGSMGAVYKAERVPVGKLVAIKFLHASYKNDSEFQSRFERETRVMSKLAHPNCVSVLDFGVWRNAPYLVMEFVDGITLRAKMDKGAMAPAQALAFARQIASGLAHAHEQGVVHRDIKPANMMITDDIGAGERIRLLDFGLARLRGNVGRDATQTNLVVGTPNYMAPEQTVPGAGIDARTDIYAVGVVLFEMVVGERPFNAEDTMQLLGMHRAAPIPRLLDHVKDGTELPDGLQELIDKAMAKSPSERYQSAIELAEAIDEVIAGRAVTRPSRDITTVAPPKQRGDSGANTPTMALDVDAPGVRVRDEEPRKRSSFLGVLIVFGGAAAMAGYLIHRSAQDNHTTSQGSGSSVIGSGSGGSGSSVFATLPADAGVVMSVPIDAGTQPDSLFYPDAAETMYYEADAGTVTAEDDAAIGSAGSGSAVLPPVGSGGSGSAGSATEGVDPSQVEDPDPAKGSASKAEDEDENAPKTTEQIEARTPPEAPHLAASIPEAVTLIKEGKRDLALASLRALWKKSPQSSYIPFLLGNLYFDQRWWSVSMDHYTVAISKAPAYRTNATINRNVIKMLGSAKTRAKATTFLRSTIGHPARAYLQAAAKNDESAVVRTQAKNLIRFIR